MTANNQTNVFAAFEMLLEEVEAEVDLVNKVGAKAFEGRDYDRAREALERAGLLTAFRDKVATLRKEWELLSPLPDNRQASGTSTVDRQNLGRIQRGLRTPERAYYRPILQALEERGGSANMRIVLKRVEQMMKGTLKPVDHEPLNSDPDSPRWHNTAQWAQRDGK